MKPVRTGDLTQLLLDERGRLIIEAAEFFAGAYASMASGLARAIAHHAFNLDHRQVHFFPLEFDNASLAFR